VIGGGRLCVPAAVRPAGEGSRDNRLCGENVFLFCAVMNELTPSNPVNTLLPVTPRVPVMVRPGRLDDLPFVDQLQKKNNKQVGFFPGKALEGKIKLGHVLVAEQLVASGQLPVASEMRETSASPSLLATDNWQLATHSVGYLIGNDQYFKRDDVGCIFQINVVPEFRRSLVAATLLKAQFERSAYGCRLYCCWCAQDIEANRFWESMGFVPLAYRAGSAKKKVGSRQRAVGREEGGAASSSSSSAYCLPPTAYSGRVHIFWQKRIRQGDATTPWWYPSQTSGGSIREDRLVLPIPPGTHWSAVMPVILPTEAGKDEAGRMKDERKKKALPGARGGMSGSSVSHQPSSLSSKALGGWSFSPPKPEKPAKRTPRAKVKNDPAQVAAARELRDRWLEHVNTTPLIGQGKYDVTRAIGQREPVAGEPTRLLTAA
jgi:hypothetical protein